MFRSYSITIPNSVTSIGEEVFWGCSGLTSVTIPESVTSIGEGAFYGSSGLLSIVIEDGNKKYDSRNDCNAIIETASNTLIAGCKNTIIPNSVTSIEYGAFSYCSGLTSITIPESVTSIGTWTFIGCEGLTTVAIPESVTSIGEGAFYGCSGLTSITIPESVTSIGDFAFSDCYALTSVTNLSLVPQEIKKCTFQNCRAVFIVPPGCGDAYNNAEYWKGSIIMEAPVEDNGIYYNINNKTKEASVRSKENGYSGDVTIPASIIYNNQTYSVTSIENGAFSGCSGLTSITVETGNSVFDSRENCNAIIETSTNTLIAGCKNTIIPNSVTSIGESAFYGCSGLISITIPNSVTSIGQWAFTYCSGLTSITIPNSVTNIGGVVFFGCSGLTSVTIPESVTSIGRSAFAYCSGLTSITIPNSVTSIGEEVFWGCNDITSITNLSLVPQEIYDDTFKNYSAVLHVRPGCKDAYENAVEWKKFTIVEDAVDNGAIAKAADDKISAIGNVEYTDACKNKIDAARSAYDALTEEQKTLVTNLKSLTDAEAKYAELKKAADIAAAIAKAAKAVDDKISAIGKVEYTDACKAKIDAARAAYDALTEEQQALVTIYNNLLNAEIAYESLKNAAELAAQIEKLIKVVNDLIAAIGKVEYTDVCKDRIDAARAAYDALPEDQRALVKNFNELIAAEEEYNKFEASTGIADINTETKMKDGKYLNNGKLVIVKNGRKYSSNGLLNLK